MLLCRLALPGRAPCFGRVLPQRPDELELLAGDPLCQARPTGERVPFQPEHMQGGEGARLLCPVLPGKIVAVGSNYRNHVIEMGKPMPREPVLFLKPPSALCDPGRPILRPPGYARVDYEGELALVVGRPMHRVSAAEALDHLLGYTALNDVTVRELQQQDGQFTRAKGFDTFCPLGPAIATDLSPLRDGRFRLRTWRNGALVQDSAGDRFLFPLPQLLAFISHVMTLLPGDVVSTGTPAGVGNLEPGDLIEIEIEGLPPLRNPVEAGPPPYTFESLPPLAQGGKMV